MNLFWSDIRVFEGEFGFGPHDARKAHIMPLKDRMILL